MSFVSSRLPWLLVVAPLALLTGCQATQVRYSPSAANSGPLGGHVMGGEQPITAATIQIYAVGTTTDGTGATPLLSATVTTSDGTGQSNANANAGNDDNQLPAGYFTVAAADFDCPSSTSLLYIAAIAGNPGNGANDAQENIAGLGPCGSLPSTVIINEITTVGTVRALSSYMTAYNAIGSTPAQAAALATAFSAVNEYVNIANGTAPGPALPSGYYSSDPDLRALANVVQSCVDTDGSTSGGSNCGTFFADAQGTAAQAPTDTVTALLDIFADPTNNVTTLFNLQGTQPAFAPTNAMAPPDWTLPILQEPSAPAISPAPGTYAAAQSVTLADADTDGTNALYYTTDGSTPSATNGTLYSGPIAVSSSTAETIKAIAIDDSRLSSAVASATYTINTALTAPTVSLASISAPYGSATGVTLTATSNAAGSVVTFGTTGSIGGSFSSPTCTISGTTCSVTYTPSGTLSAGTYTNDLTASFAAYGVYGAGYATSTFTVADSFTETVLHSFAGGSTDGQSPYYGNLIQGADGNFYGTTLVGGAHSDGTVFELTPNGTSSTVTILHSFAGGASDGSDPKGGLVQGADGNFYGTTNTGGTSGDGTVFELQPNGTNSTVTLLHSFTGGSNDGANPEAGLAQGEDGNFYGTTYAGGAGNHGTVFELVPNGTSSTVTVLHSFAAGTSDGSQPYAGLVQGADGNFYGTTSAAGASSQGTIFELVPNGTNSTFTLLHSFAGGSTDGAEPYAGLVQGTDGNFYSTTYGGGAHGDGTFFQLVPNGVSSTFTILHSFAGGSTDGSNPFTAGVMQGSDGNFYGVTYVGGANSAGTVFQLVPNGTNSTVTLIHSFAGADGQYPYGGLVQGADGNLYGTTETGGAHSEGAVFELAVTPALAAPVTFSAPSSVIGGSIFTLTYAVANAYVASPNDGTLEQCFAGAYNSSGAYTKLGTFTGSPTSQNTTLTAPSTAGTYTLGVTCGGQESSTTTLTVQ